LVPEEACLRFVSTQFDTMTSGSSTNLDAGVGSAQPSGSWRQSLAGWPRTEREMMLACGSQPQIVQAHVAVQNSPRGRSPDVSAGPCPHVVSSENKENPMNNSNALSSKHPQRRHTFLIRNLAIAAVIGVFGVAGSAVVHAQSTAGHVFGIAPAGDSIHAYNNATGAQRRVHADADGRYIINSLPVGVYTVTLEENGQPVVKHLNVGIRVGGGIKVDFDCAKGQCAQLASKP
jgi:hypothetical protein